MELFVIPVVVGLHVAAAVSTALEGKPWFLLLGLLIGWCWLFGALRLVKPHSWWARRLYDDAKIDRSRDRYDPGAHPAALPPPAYERPLY